MKLTIDNMSGTGAAVSFPLEQMMVMQDPLDDLRPNKKKGDDLESAVGAIERAILSAEPAIGNNYQLEQNKIIVKHGVRHEIDLYVETESQMGYKAVFVFECRNRRKKTSKNDIIVFEAKVEAANAQSGTFIATDFTSDARAQAAANERIQLHQAHESLNLVTIKQPFATISTVERVSVDITMSPATKLVPADMDTAEIIVDGESKPSEEFFQNWLMAAANDVYLGSSNDERLIRLINQTTKFPLNVKQAFQPGGLLINGHPIEKLRARGDFDLLVRPARLHITTIEGRGRTIRVDVNGITMSLIHAPNAHSTGN